MFRFWQTRKCSSEFIHAIFAHVHVHGGYAANVFTDWFALAERSKVEDMAWPKNGADRNELVDRGKPKHLVGIELSVRFMKCFARTKVVEARCLVDAALVDPEMLDGEYIVGERLDTAVLFVHEITFVDANDEPIGTRHSRVECSRRVRERYQRCRQRYSNVVLRTRQRITFARRRAFETIVSLRSVPDRHTRDVLP